MVPRWFYDRVLPDFGIPEMQVSITENAQDASIPFNFLTYLSICSMKLNH